MFPRFPAPVMLKTVLVLAANPIGTARLRLDQELRDIQANLRRSPLHIESCPAVRIQDLQQAMLDKAPQMVHLCGHGKGEEGLVFEDDTGQPKPVSGKALAGLFSLFAAEVECVVLNGCYSQVQAEAIAQHIPYVIGMTRAVGDRVAIAFASAFYNALGSGRDVEFAFRFGCNAVQMEGSEEYETPILLKRSDIGSTAQTPIVLELPGGLVPIGSRFYIERPPVERDCFAEIAKPGALIRVKAPRQMGKTSLMERILHYAHQDLGYRRVSISLQRTDGDRLTNLDDFLQWFCANVADQLELPDQLDDRWSKRLGSKSNCFNYFERYLLPEINAPLVLGLDEVDRVFDYEAVAKDFFGMLREWNEKGRLLGIWQNLRLVLVHSKEVYIPLHINESPFNVGMPIELQEFNSAQIQTLIQRHGLTIAPPDRQSLAAMVGGHPHLLRVALYELGRDRITLPELLKTAPTDAGIFSDHLHRHLGNLEKEPSLYAAMKEVVRSPLPVQIGTSEAFKLRSMGLVRYQGNAVEPLCDLYRRYFGDRLSHPPPPTISQPPSIN